MKWRKGYTIVLTVLIGLALWTIFIIWADYMLRGMFQY